MRYRNNQINFTKKIVKSMLNCFYQIVFIKFDFPKKFREINFLFNFTLHCFSKMNYVNTFFSSFFIAEGLLQCFQDELREHIFPSFFGPEGLGGFRNVSKMNYVNTFFPSFFDSRFSLLSIDKITSHNLKKTKNHEI